MHAAAVLFGGHAAGEWQLPAPVTEARDHVVRVTGLLEKITAETPEHPFDLRDRLALQVAEGADVDVAPIRAAEQGRADYDNRLTVLTRAREIAVGRLATVLNQQARAIVECLQVEQDELQEAMRRDFATIAHIPNDAPVSVLLSASKPVRDAAIRVDAAVGRYGLLRDAYAFARRLGDQDDTPDGYGWFNEVRNMEVVWPAINGLRAVNPADAPWPATPRDRLAWLFVNGAELWMPTAEQQTQRWLESPIGQRVKEHQANRSHLNAYRQMYGDLPGAQPAEPGSDAAAVGSRLFDTSNGVEVNGGPVES